jgi:misacylated tRNA(Ala) deacylase
MPQTRQLFTEDAYIRELSATVVAVDGPWVELDQTIFYAEGGGQPGDSGSMSKDGSVLRVSNTRKGEEPGSIRHEIEGESHSFQPGDTVDLAIDWERRYKHMRMHTSMHLLGSLIPVPVTGGQVGAEKSRLDFNLGDHKLDKEDLTTRMNELIEARHPIAFDTITEAELDEKPELVRTMSVQPPRGYGDIRMVRVLDVDYQPCGGTHVNNTGEIGKIRVSKIENKGKQNRRVHIVFDD